MSNRAPSLRALTRTPSERQLQTQIVDGLRRCGYEVQEVGGWARRAHCPACGAQFVPAHANSVGCPDLFVGRRGRNRYVALEVKRPTVKTLLGTVPGGRLSPAQRVLVDAAMSQVITSLEEALDALEAAGL